MRAIPIGQRVRTSLAAGTAAAAVLAATAACTSATATQGASPGPGHGTALVVTTADGAVRGKAVAAAAEDLGIP